MTRYEQICVEPVGRVLKLTLNRPEKLNAWTRQMEAEFITAVREAAADDSVGCIVVTGAGRAFCAGADMGGWRERHESANQPGANRSLLLSTDLSREAGPNVAPALFEGKPVIAAINGPAIGVGLTLSLACDIRIASEAARFSIRFVRVGLTPELASTHNLASVAGMEAAMELALTGRIITARDPLAQRLVSRIVPADELLPTAMALAEEIASGPLNAVWLAKRLIRQNAAQQNLRLVIESEVATFRELFGKPDHVEAVTAFTEKREPRFNAFA